MHLLRIGVGLALAMGAGAVQAGECEDNFRTDGSFFSGRRYTTHQTFQAPPEAVFRRAYAALTQDGWVIRSSDRDMMAISAATEASFGDGKSAPLNVLVEPTQNGSRVSLTFSISGGLVASNPQGNICELMAKFAPLP